MRPPNCNSAEQHALARPHRGGMMQHLVRRDIVQREARSLGGVHPERHWNQFLLRQADELRVCTMDRQRRNGLAPFDSGNALTQPVHHAC